MLQSLQLAAREPALVFFALFLLSLGAAFILFKLLDSTAKIEHREWSAGGAIAGFLIILIWSWYALKPALMTRIPLMPITVPDHFKSVSIPEAGLAVAIPSDWDRGANPITLGFAPKGQQPNSGDAKMLAVNIRPCKGLDPDDNEPDTAKMNDMLKQVMGSLFLLRGPTSSDPYLGHKGVLMPGSFTLPGKALEPPQEKDWVLNVLVHEIYDERNDRCIALIYPDTDLGREISSTLNISVPMQ